MSGAEREIFEPVALCTTDGKLAPDAIGWSRRPLHRCNLNGPWPRQKRWEYWGVTSDDVFVAITLADVDYMGLVVVTMVSMATGQVVERAMPMPLGMGLGMGERVGGTPYVFDQLGLRVAISVTSRGRTYLEADTRLLNGRRLRIDLVVEAPPRHETVNVVIPWSEERFQFTSKQNAMPVRGTVEYDGRRHVLDERRHAFACLDFGRGVWPWRTSWFWASASGVQEGRTVGLNLGGRWTDGTGLTENALCIDSKVHKIGETIAFSCGADDSSTWHIATTSSRRVDLTFRPLHHRRISANLGVLRAKLRWHLGHFHGTVVTGDGETLRIEDLLGWSENLEARW